MLRLLGGRFALLRAAQVRMVRTASPDFAKQGTLTVRSRAAVGVFVADV